MPLHTGKQFATYDPRDKFFHDYVDTDVIDLSSPPPDPTPGHGAQMPSPRLMLGNGPDTSVAPGFEGAGDCVFAGITNFQRITWSVAGKDLFPANGSTAIGNYSEVTGYVIGDQSTDNGTNMRTAMNWWRNTGYRDATGQRHQIGAWSAIKFQDLNHLLWAMYLSDGGVLIGIEFPDTAMQQFDEGLPWTPVPGAVVDGGHCVLLDLTFSAETWMREQPVELAFLEQYMDEAYFVVDTEGLVNGKTVEGFDSQQLLSDVNQLD